MGSWPSKQSATSAKGQKQQENENAKKKTQSLKRLGSTFVDAR